MSRFQHLRLFNVSFLLRLCHLLGFSVLILSLPVYSLFLLKSLAVKFYVVHWRLLGLRNFSSIMLILVVFWDMTQFYLPNSCWLCSANGLSCTLVERLCGLGGCVGKSSSRRILRSISLRLFYVSRVLHWLSCVARDRVASTNLLVIELLNVLFLPI